MMFKNISYISIPEGKVKNIQFGETQLFQRAHIYGVSWDGGTSATMSRTDDSASFVSPVIGTGTTAGSSPFDNCYPWSKIQVKTINDNVLVEIPKFWYKWAKSDSAMTLQIADKPVQGFYVSPMHADRGDGTGERDVAYIGRYKCNSSYKSQSGSSAITSITIGTARAAIKNLGTGFYQHDYAAFWTLRMLFLVEWATWDGQSILANTVNYDTVSDYVAGKCASMAYHTGVSSDGYNIQYRYVEDPWENVLEWLDGVYFSDTNMYCIKNPNDYTVGANGTLLGTRTTSEGYIKAWTIPSSSGFEWALIPTEVSSSEAYTKDGYYYASGGTVVYIGGTRSSWALHGPFFMYTDFTASSTSAVITSRIMYLP